MSFVGPLIIATLLWISPAAAHGCPGGVLQPGDPVARPCMLLPWVVSPVPKPSLFLADMQETKDSVVYSTSSPSENSQDGSMFRSPEAEEEWKREKAWEMLDNMHLGVFPGSSRDSSSGSTDNGGSRGR